MSYTNRPTPRPSAWGLLILLLSMLIPAVSATIIFDEQKTFSVDSNQHEWADGKISTGIGVTRASIIYFDDIQQFTDLNHFVAIISGSVVNPTSIAGYANDSIVPVVGTIGDDVIFTGRMGHNINYKKEGGLENVIVWIEDINDFNSYSYTGSQTVLLTWDTTRVPIVESKRPMSGYVSESSGYIPATFRNSQNGYFFPARYEYLLKHTSKNDVRVVWNDTYFDITLNRYGDYSTLLITETGTENLLISTTFSTEDLERSIPMVWLHDYDNPSIDISLDIPGEQFLWRVAPYGEPQAPQNADVLIYIKNSQTGAHIPNARAIITDATTDPLAEVVNATLPAGSGTFSLEKADTLRYHASATADNYTLLSPILFGIGDDGATIVLWMAPDAAPDVPTEEGKSPLYGYAITQGSQQPISGATVSLDGYGSTTTTSTGFYLFNNVTPGTYDISASAPLHDALSEPVTVDATATPYNLALKGHFLLTVSAKDADDLTTLHNTTISLSDGQESTQNPATFTADYGPYTITAAAGGYYPQTQSAYLDRPGTTTATVLLTERPPPATPAEMPNYPQHNVRFLCVDEYNHPLQNVTITAVYQESSGPVSWITDWLGLSQNVHVANSTLQGTTGLDGSVIFLMVQSVQYRMTVAAPAPLNMTKTFDLYPKEDQITIRFVTSPVPDLSTMPAYDLTATEINASSVRLALTYNDTTNATTHLSFQVYDHATGDVINTQTFGASSFPGTVSPTYTVENTKGAMYRFGFEATNTAHGPISQYTGITLKGDNLLVDLGFEDRTLYQWLAVILLFLFAGAFSGTNVKQGAILVPAFGGGLFWFIGWLPASLGGVISAIGFLGVLVYMRKSEWKVRA